MVLVEIEPRYVSATTVSLSPRCLSLSVSLISSQLSAAGQTSQTLRTWDACVRDSYAARNGMSPPLLAEIF